MKVFDPTQNAGIEFLHNDGNYRLMDGGQYYLDVTHPIPTKYGDPPNYECIFMNDLLDFPLTNTTLDLKVLLEGPYDPATNKMGTDIVSNSLFPPDQPFQPPLPYYGNMNPVWYYAGTEAVATAPQDAVDWILLELRDAPDAAAATPATTVGKMAAVLLKDGSVVTTDGFSMPVFPVAIAQGLFTVIYHRNHLPVMNAIPLQAVNGLYTCNFTTGPDKVYGGATGYSELEPGVWGLASSDGNADGQSSNNDKNDVWILQAGSSGYLPGDFNLDTQVNNTDKNECWILNSGMGSQVPD
ncbi:MAG: hypothetical protein JXA03_12290 [Bacteroidales bacterium]|nr:hypothetical protein [Bacteroidales bacterium]